MGALSDGHKQSTYPQYERANGANLDEPVQLNLAGIAWKSSYFWQDYKYLSINTGVERRV